MFLSTALVMEGYDLVIVSAIFHQIQLKPVRTNQSVLDHLILRPDPVQGAIRRRRPKDRPQADNPGMAIGSF